MELKPNIAIFFGGESVEHDISVLTGMQVINAISDKYNIYPIYIDRTGKWFLKIGVKNVDDINKIKVRQVNVISCDNYLYSFKKKICEIHSAVLAMHGRYGEDGALQGILECSNIPYTSCDIKSSALTMDKISMKKYFEICDAPVLEYFCVNLSVWQRQKEVVLSMAKDFGYPLIVKPSKLGSSIGISLAEDENGLIKAIELALEFDKNLLIERAVKDLVEVNASCFSYKGELMVSELERPIKSDEILSFEDKYKRGGKSTKGGTGHSGGKGGGMASLSRVIPADITSDIYNHIVELVKKIYIDFGCSGVIRCDFILNGEKVYVNEINSIPGSLAFYLWQAKGISFTALLNMLIEDSLWRKQNDDCIKVFNSGLIK